MGQLTSSHFTMSDGISIHALLSPGPKAEAGKEAQTLLCISGFGCSHYNFLEMAKDLGHQYKMVLLDNRGMGESGDAQEDYKLDTLATDAIEVMNQLGVEEFHLAGISMGGFVAQLLMSKAAKRVKSLSLLCTTSGGAEYIPLPPMAEEHLIQFYKMDEPRRTEIAIEATVHHNLKESNRELFESICQLRRSHPIRVEQVLKQKRAVDKFLSTEVDLSKINCPTFILSGDSDRFVSPENSKRLNQKISGSKLFLVEQSDHLFFLERPRVVAEIVNRNLQNI